MAGRLLISRVKKVSVVITYYRCVTVLGALFVDYSFCQFDCAFGEIDSFVIFVRKITRWSGAIKIVLLFLSLRETFSKQLLLLNKSFQCVVWNILLKMGEKNI